MAAQTSKRLESYHLTVEPMSAGDVPRLHALSVSVGWPHRAEDWALMIALGEGFVARDEIGRVVGSAMWFALGERFASIGMVIVTPRLQELGGGRWLMEHVLERVEGRGKVLNATREAFRLYSALDFAPLAPSYQHNGVVRASPPEPPPGVRRLRPDDAQAATALDAAAIGAPRVELMRRLLEISAGFALEREGEMVGFSLCRAFGRGHVIGPLVAADEADAVDLVAPHLRGREGQFLRMDTREAEGPLRALLVASGLRCHDTVTRMALGPALEPAGPARTFALVSQAFG